jgi:hypothetical protein
MSKNLSVLNFLSGIISILASLKWSNPLLEKASRSVSGSTKRFISFSDVMPD